ncbi:ataxia telangiectasia mutated family protein [Tanacetum coccineum]
MATLKFADSHNMVAFLSKPAECEGFEQIVDFLNAHPIRYALTVNPTIYISCIEQLWSSVVAKTINGEVQLHAIVDGKRIVITETSDRRTLRLADNEVSNMVRNLDNLSGKFLMYPRFLQVFLDKQFAEKPTHKRIYIAPCHTKKIFGNMRRVGKGFSSKVTPLFPAMVVQNQPQQGEGSAIPTDPQHTPTILHPSTSQPQKTQTPRELTRMDTEIPQSSGPTKHVADEVVHKERGDSLVRAATTASSLEAEQVSGNINKTQSKATLNEPSSLGTSSGSGPRCQEIMGDTIAQTRFENVSTQPNDSLLARGNTLRSDEGSMKLHELMALCTNLQKEVLDLKKTTSFQQIEITSLKRRVKKLEKKRKSRPHGLKRLYRGSATARVDSSEEEEVLGEDASKQGRSDNVDTLFSGQDKEMLNAGEEVVVVDEVAEVIKTAQVSAASEKVSTASATTTNEDDLTLARALADLKSTKPKAKGIVFREPSESTTTTTLIPSEVQDKGKEKMIEPEPVKKMSKKDQLRSDEKEAKRLQAEFDEEERLAREKDEANVALTDKYGMKFSSKRAGEELEQESTKKQKVDEDKNTAELQSLIEVIPDEEDVSINVVPLATKPLSIVDGKIHTEGKKSYYQIIRADGKSQMYLVFSHMLKSFDRKDLETLWKLGRIVGNKSFLMLFGVTAALIDVNAAQSNLVLLDNFNENYSKCLRLLLKLQCYYCWYKVATAEELMLLVKKLVLLKDLNGHIGAEADGFSSVHGGFGYGVRNEEGHKILEFAATHDLVVVNSFFKKRDAHLITYHSGDHDTQIDYMLVRRGDLRVCKDCKVFPGEVCFSQHRLLALDINIKRRPRSTKMAVKPRILWKNLHGEAAEAFRTRVTEGVTPELGGRTTTDAEQMWNRLANTIREAAKETLGVVAGASRTHIGRRESWWFSEEVQNKVKAKQTRFRELISMQGNEADRSATEERIAKARQRRKLDLGSVRFIKDEDGRSIVNEDAIWRRWKEYFFALFNRQRHGRTEDVDSIGAIPQNNCYCSRIRHAEVKETLRKIGRNKAVGPDKIPIEAWRCLGGEGVRWLTILFNKTLSRAKMLEEWRLSEDMYEGARTCVRTPTENSEYFPVDVGLHQGSAISPYLFSLILDELSRGIQESIPWCLIFADDIVLVSDTPDGLNGRLEQWREMLENKGLRVSGEKTEYMRCDFNRNENDQNEEAVIRIGEHILEPNKSFRYLGSVIQKSGRIEDDVTHRIQAGWLKWRAATGILCDKNVPLKLKGKFYKVAIRPAMLYGSECWPLTKAQANRMEVSEMRMLRWTCGKTLLDMIPNGAFRRNLQVATIVNKMREGRLRWFGHVKRRPQSAPVRRVEAIVVDGVRRRGRPKLRWEDTLKTDLKELLLSEDMTSNRNSCRFFWGFKDSQRGISWVKWKSMLLDPDKVGLGIGSIHAKNMGLLGKWKWRFLIEHDALWRLVIREFYGEDGGFYAPSNSSIFGGVWVTSLRLRLALSILSPLTKIRSPSRFQMKLMCLSGRTFGIPRENMSLSPDGVDTWQWNFDSSDKFKVSTLSRSIHNLVLADDIIGLTHNWNSWIPRKINICVWRAALNRLPTRSNPESRGVPIASVMCPFCDNATENEVHCLLYCPHVVKEWRKVWGWWNLGLCNVFPPFSIRDIALGSVSDMGCNRLNKILHGVFRCSLWAIWNWRNKLANANLEDVTSIREEDIFPSIQRLSKTWIAARFSKGTVDWNKWISSPYDILALG